MTVGINFTNCLYYLKYKIEVKSVELEFNHISVLLQECIENLNIKPDGMYVDGTMRWRRTQP